MPAQRVGEVVRTAQGLAIVRCPGQEHPPIGRGVVDESLTEVGRVVDVFGPTARPFVAVTPAGEVSLPMLLGKRLYAR
jgi:RNA-binding protein